MLNRLRNNSLLAIACSLFLWTPFAGFGQNSIEELKQEAKAAKLTPDLLSIQLEATQQKPLSQKSSNLRQAAPSTNDSQTLNKNQTDLRYGKLSIRNSSMAEKQALLKGGQVKTVQQQEGSLRQAALSEEDIKSMQVNMTQMRDGMIAIEAISNDVDGQALLNDLQALGLKDGRYYQRIVFGYFPVDQLGLLRNVSTLHVARPALRAFKRAGKVTSQGDRVMHADIARQTYNVTGAGSKVGIISDSYNALGGAAVGVASGDLPPNVQVLKDYTEIDATDEGRGMAEIVHDVAPGANIAFHTAAESKVDFALGVRRLANAGCNIIVDDVGYLDEPYFQDGIAAQAVDYVKEKQNVTYFSSAGNDGRQSYTSGFHNSGKLPTLPPGFSIPGSSTHDFGNGKISQKITLPPRGRFFCFLQWSDPFYSESVASGGVSGAKTDIDMLVYYQGQLVGVSIDPNIGSDPFEYVLLQNPFNTTVDIELVILKYEGPDPSMIKWIEATGDPIAFEFNTNSSTLFGHANAKGAIAVGAAAYYQTPDYIVSRPNVYVPNLPNPIVENFSSAGGTPILFTTYGQPIPSEIRLKPEVVAPHAVNTSFFPPDQDLDGDGFPNFGGTSAAAPHAAGVAALLQERSRNSMSPAAILLRLRTTALDMDDPLTPGFDMGFDFASGYGFIQADKALMYGQPLVILEPLYDCGTGKISLRTSGGDGTPITFTVPGVRRTPPTSTTALVGSLYSYGLTVYTTYTPISTTGIVEAELRNDPKSIIITAEQSGVKTVYDFNFVNYCRNQNQASRLAATEPKTDLQITTLGNPIASDWVEVEVKGAQGQPLTFQVNNTLGEVTSQKAVELSESVERHKLSLGGVPGLYFLQVSTPAQSKTVKVIRQ